MPKGELYINGKDAYTEWGISMDSSALSALMTPAGMKERVENQSRMEHGKRVLNTMPKIASRDVTVSFNLSASTETMFFSRYSAFCTELAGGSLHIRTKYQPTTVYRMLYVSCSQFTQFMRGIAKFTLKMEEPNPSDRGV